MPTCCSIVIPTFQRAELLRHTLDSLALQTCADFELIVVNDGVDRDTRELSENYRSPFPLQWILRDENSGQASARNLGASAANGRLLLFLDDDTLADADLVRQHVMHPLHEDPNWLFVIYGRSIEEPAVPPVLWTDRFLQKVWEQTQEDTRLQRNARDLISVGEEAERSTFFGLNCSIRRDIFLRSGGFRPELRYQDEDMELGLRLFRSGVRFRMNPEAIVFHRNTKPMTAYFRNAWYNAGRVDTVRVMELGERSPQTKYLASQFRGKFRRRILARAAWTRTESTLRFANMLERVTNQTGSRLFFRSWEKVGATAHYWRGVKDSQVTEQMLREAAGEPGCALAFHSLSAPSSRVERTYYLTPAKFEAFTRKLMSAGFESANLDEWIQGRFTRRRILWTFDDAYDDLYSQLVPTVLKLDLKPVVFVVANRQDLTNFWDHRRGLRRRNLLTNPQILEMQRLGFEFGSHSFSHSWLPDLDDATLRREVIDSKHALEDLLGREVRAFAYPYGGVDERVRAAVAEAGYKVAFTCFPGVNGWNDPLTLRRAEISEETSTLDLFLKPRTGCSAWEWLKPSPETIESRWPERARGHLRKAARVLRTLGGREVAMPPRQK